MSARSHLYVPANDLERLTKALGRGADALIVDLEDGVSPTDKVLARQNLVSFLNDFNSEVEIWVRVNPEKGALELDLAAAVHKNCRGIVLAKATTLAEIQNLDSLITDLETSRGLTKKLEVSALIESAAGVFNAQAIATGPRVTRLQLGEADLRADLGTSGVAGETTTQFARSMAVFASAAAGINPPVAAVSTNFKDLEAYKKSSQDFKEWGYFGRACIHPAQIEIANEVFTPNADELAAAQDILDRLVAAGGGVALDAKGRMIDEAIAKIARRTLATGKQATMAVIKSQDLRDMSGAVEVPIPDSTDVVKMHRLHTWENGTSVMIVNFPAGWSRPVDGSYECAEEFFVFEGELQMSGQTIVAGDHAWVPPHSLRIGAYTPNGAVAIAWFYGAPKWNRREGSEGSVSQIKTHIDNNAFGEIRPAGANGITGQTIKLPASDYVTPAQCEVIDIANRSWSLYEKESEVKLTDLSLIRL